MAVKKKRLRKLVKKSNEGTEKSAKISPEKSAKISPEKSSKISPSKPCVEEPQTSLINEDPLPKNSNNMDQESQALLQKIMDMDEGTRENLLKQVENSTSKPKSAKKTRKKNLDMLAKDVKSSKKKPSKPKQKTRRTTKKQKIEEEKAQELSPIPSEVSSELQNDDIYSEDEESDVSFEDLYQPKTNRRPKKRRIKGNKTSNRMFQNEEDTYQDGGNVETIGYSGEMTLEFSEDEQVVPKKKKFEHLFSRRRTHCQKQEASVNGFPLISKNALAEKGCPMKLSLGDSGVIRASKEETKDPRVYQQKKTIGFKSNMDVDDCEIEFVDPERIAREEREKKEAEKDEDDKPKAPITAMELAPSAYSKRARFMKDLSNKSMEKTTFEEIISRNKVTTIEDLNKTNFNGLDEHLSPIAKKNALIKEQLIKELEQEIEDQEYLGEGEDSEYIPEDVGDNLDIHKNTIKEPNEAIQIAHDVINSLISTLPVFQHPSPPLSPTPPSAPPASSEPPLSPSSSKETQEIQHEISLLHLRLQKKQLSKTLSKLAPKGLSETFKSYQEFNVKKDTNKAKRKNRGVLGLRKVLARHKAEERCNF